MPTLRGEEGSNGAEDWDNETVLLRDVVPER